MSAKKYTRLAGNESVSTVPQAESNEQRMARAVSAHQAGELAQARQLYLEILAQNPRQPDALHLLGMVEYQAGRPEAAAKLIARALAVRDRDPAYHANLGLVLLALGRAAESAEACRQALRLKPEFAAAHNNLGNALKELGRTGEAEACYRRAVELDPKLVDALYNLAGIYAGREQAAEAVELYEKVLALEPGHATAHNNLGAALFRLERWKEAAAHLERAVAENPGDVKALGNLGRALLEERKPEEAERWFRKAVALEPERSGGSGDLGAALRSQGRLEEALKAYERAVALAPSRADAHSDLGMVLSELGREAEARERYEQALALEPEHVSARWNRSLLLLRQGDWRAGWREFEWRRSRKKSNSTRDFAMPRWDGGPLGGKRILLHAEQGLGDTLQFLRYVPLVQRAGGVVILDVQKPLQRLAATMPGVEAVMASGEPLPAFDVHCPLMSLGLAFGTEVGTIPAEVPYLRVPEDATEAAAARAWPEGLRVGLVWAGSQTHPGDRFRSMSLAQLEPLLAVEGVHFFSLQMGAADAIAQARGKIVDMAPASGEMAETAASLEHLDLLITVDTSVAHLAGALGRPVWVLVPFVPDWRWMMGREDSPWYPTMRLFREERVGDWGPVVERVRGELVRLAGGDRSVLEPERRAGAAEAERAGTAALPVNAATEPQRRRATIEAHATDVERWANPGQLEEAWNQRARIAADGVVAGATVLDLGCGRMALERYLPADCRYQPCDVVRRDERTVVCDFNKGEMPDEAAEAADMVTALGVLEYIFEPGAFLKRVHGWKKTVLMSYCATEAIGDRERRRSLGWVNDLSRTELEGLFAEAGFAVERADRIDAVQWLYRLRPEAEKRLEVKSVGVLSFCNATNFGDRLGFHLVNEILPAHAEVTHLSFKPWRGQGREFDLLIVGVGNSLFGPYVHDDLLALTERSRHAIGIFGTQYHESMPRSALCELIGRMDHWYARYEDDVLRYGRGCGNVSHLGDWMVRAFPMSRPVLAEQLTVGQEIWNDLPLDRTIQRIQSYATVFSERIHPLLCALTSAERVGYREQREVGGGLVSGKFRSLLVDVFGRHFPEETMFEVERDLVRRYKARVDANVERLRAHVRRLLAN